MQPRTARFGMAFGWVALFLGLGHAAFNSVVAITVLTGTIRPEGEYDRKAMIGHAFIWDPWFFAWGLALVIFLALTSRNRSQPNGSRGRRPAAP